ncbi:hypothetical protein EV359DRAFT_84085 [Lentinula novae-zelandiae]|nr:hypothetical protein EV359DRAFT_84085 [Lentinula novae-zelandiae]
MHHATWGIPLETWQQYDANLHQRTSSTAVLLELNMLDDQDADAVDWQELRTYLALQQEEAAIAARCKRNCSPSPVAGPSCKKTTGSEVPKRCPRRKHLTVEASSEPAPHVWLVIPPGCSVSRYATLGLIRAWVSHIVGGAHTTLLYTLLEQSLELRRLNENFLAFPAIHKIRDNVVCFFELKGEVGVFGRVVDEEYACIDSFQRISCNSTHKGLNKFSERNGEYRDIYRSIQRAYTPIVARSKLDNYANSEYAFFCKITGDGFLVFDHDEACVRQTDSEWIIYQRGSGHSCTLLFQHEKTQTKIAVTMGVHNYAPWVFVSTDVETETAVQTSFYDDKGKRPYTHNHWHQVRTSNGNVPSSNVSATAEITNMEDMEKRYQAMIELSGFDG